MNDTTRVVARHACGTMYDRSHDRCPGCQEPVGERRAEATAARSFADADATELFATIERLDLDPARVAAGFRAEAGRQLDHDDPANRALAEVCDRLADAIGEHYYHRPAIELPPDDDHEGWTKLEADVLGEIHGSSAAADAARLALAADHLQRAAALLSGSHERHDSYDDKTRVLLVSCWESEAVALRARAERLAGA